MSYSISKYKNGDIKIHLNNTNNLLFSNEDGEVNEFLTTIMEFMDTYSLEDLKKDIDRILDEKDIVDKLGI